MRWHAAILMGALVLPASAHAQMNLTGSDIKDSCRLAVAANKKGNAQASGFQGGFCVGMVSTIMSFTHFLKDEMRTCVPLEAVTPHMAVVAFIKYLDDHPKQLGEPSILLAHKALDERWPCPKQTEIPPKLAE
jgi:hypothetical protein